MSAICTFWASPEHAIGEIQQMVKFEHMLLFCQQLDLAGEDCISTREKLLKHTYNRQTKYSFTTENSSSYQSPSLYEE